RPLPLPGGGLRGAAAPPPSAARPLLHHPATTAVHTLLGVDTVAPRLNAPHRPLLRGSGSAVENWLALVSEREPLYEQVATFRVQASNSPPSTVVNRIV
ncbi:hypothetical protein KCW65_23590, partial [Mycobacterium tuberculosis]|nr:hypothetical protein [Mycobacterium tuberculosis]